ncbi:MAG: HEAT repeat domain-containing protein [Planctomycetota bacterium]|nr:HEAT repeat domain-containing protein [Planctomycetota bacterium]
MRDRYLLFAVMLSLFGELSFVSALSAETADEARARALGVLKSDAPLEQKAAACRDLARVGDKDCVPVLAGMLGDEKLSHMARYALEPIPDKSVDEALRAVLDKLNGKILSGVIRSIGVRRDSAAVELLAKQLGNRDGEVVRTTAITLGRIGTAAADKTLLEALKHAQGDDVARICDGLLGCGANLVAEGKQGAAKDIYDGMLVQNLPVRIRAAALRGVVLCDPSNRMKLLTSMLHDQELCVFAMALRGAVEMKDQQVTDVLVAEVAKLSADRVIPVVSVLGQRADKAALPTLLEMTKKGDLAVRVEAIQAVAEIGDASAVPALVELIKEKDDKINRPAATALAGLPGPKVDSAIVAILEKPDPTLGIKMFEIAGQRRIAQALPAMVKGMSDADLSVRTVAVRSYGEVAGPSGIPLLVDLLVKSTDDRELAAYEKVLGPLSAIASDKDACATTLVNALAKARPTVKAALLRTLQAVGGAGALKAVRGAVDDADKDVHAVAIRVISEWKSAEAAPVLLELAKHSDQQVDRILVLRGYLGIATQKDVSAPERLAICRAAAPLVQRAEEKRMLLGAIAGLANAEALDLIVLYVDDPAVKREAVATVMSLAEKRPKKQYTGVAKSALEKVVKVAGDDPAAQKRAEELLKQISDEK